MLGHFVDAVRRIVGDDDAGPRRGIEVYGIDADPVAGDDPALAHARHHLRRNWSGVGVEKRIAILCLRHELVRILGLERDEIGQSLQRFLLDVQRVPDVVGKNDFCFAGHVEASGVDLGIPAVGRPPALHHRGDIIDHHMGHRFAQLGDGAAQVRSE